MAFYQGLNLDFTVGLLVVLIVLLVFLGVINLWPVLEDFIKEKRRKRKKIQKTYPLCQ